MRLRDGVGSCRGVGHVYTHVLPPPSEADDVLTNPTGNQQYFSLAVDLTEAHPNNAWHFDNITLNAYSAGAEPEFECQGCSG